MRKLYGARFVNLCEFSSQTITGSFTLIKLVYLTLTIKLKTNNLKEAYYYLLDLIKLCFDELKPVLC